MDAKEAKQLLEKYNAGLCNEAEKALVESALLDFNEGHELELSQERIDEIKREVFTGLPVHRSHKLNIYIWIAAAAAVALLILAIVHWKLEENLRLFDQNVAIPDVAPIGNRAVLSVGDELINLDGVKGGLRLGADGVAYLDGSIVGKNLKTQLSQTLSTPKGGQYQVVLSDGSRVWLNAASSISYPSSFDGAKERRVSVTGEVYFEVAHDRSKPFVVASAGQEIKVLGTNFNVNAYGDNGVTATTLLEGSVLVRDSHGVGEVLKPMQQLVMGRGGSLLRAADAELVMAWKNGKLEFKDAPLSDILAEVARWYDLEIVYEGGISDRVFTGSVSRKSNLSVLLKILSFSDVRFRLETSGRGIKKLIVEP